MKNSALLFMILLAGCASVPPEPALFAAYEKYNRGASSENIQDSYAKYFSRDITDGKNIENKEVLSQLLFKNLMVKVNSHHENMRGSKGCLTINGHDKEGMPLSFNIEYVPSAEYWLINAVDVLFVNSVAEFSREGRCPSDYIN